MQKRRKTASDGPKTASAHSAGPPLHALGLLRKPCFFQAFCPFSNNKWKLMPDLRRTSAEAHILGTPKRTQYIYVIVFGSSRVNRLGRVMQGHLDQRHRPVALAEAAVEPKLRNSAPRCVGQGNGPNRVSPKGSIYTYFSGKFCFFVWFQHRSKNAHNSHLNHSSDLNHYLPMIRM